MATITDSVTETSAGVVVRVMVTAGSKNPALFTSYNSWRKTFHCNLGARASGGKANRELEERCATYFGIAPRRVRIIGGHTSTTKKILLTGISRDEVILRIEQDLKQH